MVLGRDGSVWLRRELDEGPTMDWWVLDADGSTRGVVALPAKLRALTADRSTVWGAIEDDLDVSYLVRYDVVPAT